MRLFLAESKVSSASSAMALKNPKTTVNLGGAARQTRRQTCLVSRQRRANLAPIRSSALIVGETTKPTPTNALSRDTNSTENGNKRNTPRSVKTGLS